MEAVEAARKEGGMCVVKVVEGRSITSEQSLYLLRNKYLNISKRGTSDRIPNHSMLKYLRDYDVTFSHQVRISS